MATPGRGMMVPPIAAVAACVAAAASFACRDVLPTATTPAGAARAVMLRLPTPDGTFNLIHPSVHCNDRTCVMLASQHTARDNTQGAKTSTIENTVGYRSAGTDMLSWTPLVNPIMSADDIDSMANFSDPELLDLRPRLVAYSRLVPAGFDVLYMRESGDTVTWSPLTEVLRGPRNSLLSPTVLQNGNSYDLWVVDAGPAGCSSDTSAVVRRRSSSYADFSQAVFASTDLNDLSVPGMVPWHIEIVRGPADRPDSIVVLVAMHPQGTSCASSSLYIGTTVDGTHFTINPGPMRTWREDDLFSMIYRSSGVYFAKDRTFTALLSGMKAGGQPESRLARIRYDYDSLLAITRQGLTPTPLPAAVVPH